MKKKAMKKKVQKVRTPVYGVGEETVRPAVREPRSSRAEAEARLRPLAMALAAGRVRALLDDHLVAEDQGESAAVAAAFKIYFGERGVRFDAAGAPLFPVGRCGAVDLEILLEEVSRHIVLFFCEAVPMRADVAAEEYTELGWRHGFVYTYIGGDPRRFLVPVVVGVDLGTMTIVASDGANRWPLPSAAHLVAQQRPLVWAQWTQLIAGTT